MKIGIDIRSTLKRKTGIGYYTINLVNGLARLGLENTYYLYCYIRPFDFKRRPPQLPGPNFRRRVDRISFRPELQMADMDVFHTSSYDMPRFEATKLITTIHDIIPLVYSEGYPKDVLEDLKAKIKKTLSQSDLIVTDSNSTKKDLEERFSPDPGKIRVIYPGRDSSFTPMDDKKTAANYVKNKYGVDKEFILFVGTIEKRKNVKSLMQVFFDLRREKKISHELVVIGMKGWGGEPALELFESSELKREVKLVGYIKREDLIFFYNAADVFVYPSFYEGFGFPILEAFGCGTPVITSSTTSCGEIAGDAAYTVDPADTNALKEAVVNVLGSDRLRHELQVKGLGRARTFTWEKTAQQFQGLFREIA